MMASDSARCWQRQQTGRSVTQHLLDYTAELISEIKHGGGDMMSSAVVLNVSIATACQCKTHFTKETEINSKKK